VAEKSWPLAQLPERTILVAFSRQMVLHLKTELEYAKRRVSVVYGNLPPEVRRKQADRFANGETDICVATDAVGMGLNLPADAVCFYETQKYDGKRIRYLTSSEVQQIGGRAGRFGLSQGGEVGATNKQDLSMIRKLFHAEPLNLTRARVAPTVQDLEILPGNLAERLAQWASLQSIPDSLRDAIETADMKERVELASLLTDQQVNQLGMAAALKLVNAPTRQSSRTYWLNCAHAVLAETPMPLPPSAPNEITTSDALEKTETSISCADIYLWLSRRQEFGIFAPHQLEVRDMRAEWSLQIDEALVQKLDTARRCSQCSRPLPLNHRFSLCNRCYNLRYNYYEEDEFDYR
jgi:ATP-dependent RNA helicase SUPV3L1/SUV3